jgi:hypothetical protein
MAAVGAFAGIIVAHIRPVSPSGISRLDSGQPFALKA